MVSKFGRWVGAQAAGFIILAVSVAGGCQGNVAPPGPRGSGDATHKVQATPPAPPREQDFQGLRCVEVLGGTFTMGSPPDEPGREPNEAQRTVAVTAFWMSTTEVTQDVFERHMGHNPSRLVGARLPVTFVTWEEAVRFCNRIGEHEPAYRFSLPSEEEWEYACRAGSNLAYGAPDGNESELREALGKFQNGDGDFLARFVGRTAWFGRDGPQAVGSLRPNAWGLFDMQGNVWEWCAADPSVPGPRPLRGGAWSSTDVLGCRAALRAWEDGDVRKDSIGFRVVAVPR